MIIQSLEMVFNPVSQALASLLSKRVGGAEKEKDLFELPALPKKVLVLPFSLSSIDFRRKTGAVTAMREQEKMHLTPLVLVMSGMSIRYSIPYNEEFSLDTLPS